MRFPVLSRGGLAVLILCALCAPGAAQAQGWTPTGPFGGNVALAVHPMVPGVLYTAVYPAGVLRTRDAGASWQLLPGTAGLNLVAIDPTQPRTLYATSPMPMARVFKSTDEGARWRVVSRNLPAHLNITRLVVDPARPSRLYLTATTNGVWRSGDGGATWQRLSQGLPAGGSTNVPVLVVPRKPGGTAFAGTFGSGVFRTRNAGGSWEPVRGGLPVGPVAALAVAPSDPRTLYASIEDAGVFRSRDGGNSWVPAGNPAPEGSEISSLAVHPRSPLTVYAGDFGTGIFRTTDGGRRWTPTTTPPSIFVTLLALDASAALYAGALPLEADVGGVLRSADGGASWERRNGGIPGLRTLSVAVDPADPDNLVTSVNGPGLFRTANAAARWVPVRGSFPPGRISGVLTSEVIAGGAGTFYFVDQSREPRIWKSSDAGRTWTPLSGPPGSPQRLRADPLDPETLYVLVPPALYRSEDGGATWAPLAALPATCTVFDLEVARTSATAPAVLYLAGSKPPAGTLCRAVNQPAVFRSPDGGATWTDASAGLPGEVIADLAVDPQDPRIAYAGVGAGVSFQPLGVWKSTDSGASWQATGLDDRVIRVLAVSPAGTLWAGTVGGELYRSEDFGATWQELSGELILETFELAFAPDRVYAATTGGVWVFEE